MGKNIFLKVDETLQTGNVTIKCVTCGCCSECCFDRDFVDKKIIGGELACKDMLCSEYDRNNHVNTIDYNEIEVSFIIEEENLSKD